MQTAVYLRLFTTIQINKMEAVDTASQINKLKGVKDLYYLNNNRYGRI